MDVGTEEDVAQTLLAELAFGSGADVFIGEPVVSCLGGLMGGIKSVISGMAGGDDKTGELLLDASVRELQGHVLRLAYQIDRLRQETDGACPNPNDTFAIGSAYATARARVADEGMRGALHSAVFNSFDPEVYRRGYTLRLYGVLERLTFEDLRYLDRLRHGDVLSREYRSIPSGSGERLHADRLLAEHLVCVREVPAGRPAPTIDGEGLYPSDLGELLLRLISASHDEIPADWSPPWERDSELFEDDSELFEGES